MQRQPRGGQTPPLVDRLRIMIEHTELFEQLYHTNEEKNPSQPPFAKGGVPLKQFATMKKHFKAYATGFDGAKELRIQLMATESAAQVRSITEDFIHKFETESTIEL